MCEHVADNHGGVEVIKELSSNDSTTSSSNGSTIDNEINELDLQENSYVDPLCDPENPIRVPFSDISAAALNIRSKIMQTPTFKSNQFSEMFQMELFLKKENLQVTGSFKERGACNALIKLSAKEKMLGVIAASAGNHALALAYHGQQIGVPVTVVMPNFAPLMKISCCQTYGANVILHGANIQESKEYAFKMSKSRGMKYINGYDNPSVIAGQGTIGLDIMEQVNNVEAIIVPVGGGGLIAGIAIAVKTLKTEIKIIGVESDTCASFQKMYYERPCTLNPEISLADGLAVPAVGTNAIFNSRGLIDDIITVTEESIALAILRLIEIEKSVVEGAGAVGLAALLSGKLDYLKNKRVICILTGGNIDTTVLGRTIERGLAVDGRLIKFDVVVSDRPGGIAELTAEIARHGASIKDIFHERAWLAAKVFSVQVRVVAETRDATHAQELMEKLRSKYKQISYTIQRNA